MQQRRKRIRIGICGCGAIGSRIAHSIKSELKQHFQLTGLFDSDQAKAGRLAATCKNPALKRNSYQELLNHCDLMVEAVNTPAAEHLLRAALLKHKDILAMSVGRLLHADKIFALAQKNDCHLLIPSGAIAGIDALKAASLKHISQIILTTRKPLKGFGDIPYLRRRKIRLDKITKTTLLFEGTVSEAVRHFPKNINVAATLALASRAEDKLLIRILTSPDFTHNSHEIEIQGDFGRLITRTENEVCPDNPKTSYLAVLSAIQSLRDFGRGTRIGT